MNIDYYIGYANMQRKLFQATAAMIDQNILAQALNNSLTKEALWAIIEKKSKEVYRVAFEKGRKETAELFRQLKKLGREIKEDKGSTFVRIGMEQLYEFCWKRIEIEIRRTRRLVSWWHEFYLTAHGKGDMNRAFDIAENAAANQQREQELLNNIRRAVLWFLQNVETHADIDGRDAGEREEMND